jgi:nucleoside 2-deoxyribosyltransferase
VLIASPGDTGRERDAVEKALHGWNNARAEHEQIHLAPWRWELHAVPELGGSAQAIIDRQAVDACDVVIAVFNAYLGTATDNAASGTAHEIIRAHRAGKPVHVYFSTEPLPRETKPHELKRLNDFKAEMRAEGLLGDYAGVEISSSRFATPSSTT